MYLIPRIPPICSLLAVLALSASAAFAGEEWITLFDGKSLKGWKQLDGAAKFEVRDGAIVGAITPGVESNSFLATVDDTFEDFIIECEFKCELGMNSGIQFRSIPANPDTRRVSGYQYEIDPTPRALTAGIQEEGGAWRRSTPEETAKRAANPPSATAKPGAFWLAPVKNNGEPAKEWVKIHGDILKHGEWNLARIEARGTHLRTWLNGVPMADIEDTADVRIRRGFIALQVHKSDQSGKEVSFRNIRVKKLN